MNVENINLPRDEIEEFCRRWKIREFALFGSVLRGDFGPESDIDVLVAYAPEATWSLLDEVRMEQELAALLNRKVELVSRWAVEHSANWIRRDAILGSAEVFYAAR